MCINLVVLGAVNIPSSEPFRTDFGLNFANFFPETSSLTENGFIVSFWFILSNNLMLMGFIL